MEILRVSPYAEVPVNFVIPAGVTDADITVTITDMADLSISTSTFTESSSGELLEISLPGKYDSSYRVEIVKYI